MGKPLLKRRVLPVELCGIEEDDTLSILRHSGSSVGLLQEKENPSTCTVLVGVNMEERCDALPLCTSPLSLSFISSATWDTFCRVVQGGAVHISWPLSQRNMILRARAL